MINGVLTPQDAISAAFFLLINGRGCILLS